VHGGGVGGLGWSTLGSDAGPHSLVVCGEHEGRREARDQCRSFRESYMPPQLSLSYYHNHHQGLCLPTDDLMPPFPLIAPYLDIPPRHDY
jgi:hypothetical protein